MDRHIPFRGVLVMFASCATMVASSSCGSDPPSPEPPVDTDAGSGCSRPGDTYRVGMAKTSASGKITVELLDANPAPPGFGENHWSLKIVDSSQAPVVGARVSLALRMPDHADHTLPGTVGVETADGPYDVANLNLTMPGLYNISVEVTPMIGETDSVVFQFCVARKGN